MKLGQGNLIKFLSWRQELQGRVHTNDETDIWATFLQKPKFSIPEEKQTTFRPSPMVGELFEELYKQGLGFTKEKNYDKKKDKRWKVLAPHEFRKPLS